MSSERPHVSIDRCRGEQHLGVSPPMTRLGVTFVDRCLARSGDAQTTLGRDEGREENASCDRHGQHRRNAGRPRGQL
jgi:hypothetical protein